MPREYVLTVNPTRRWPISVQPSDYSARVENWKFAAMCLAGAAGWTMLGLLLRWATKG